MSSFYDKVDWVAGNWIGQLLFYIAGLVVATSAQAHASHEDTVWFFITVLTVQLVFGLLNMLIFRGAIRHLLSLTLIMTNVFVTPLAFHSFTGDLGVAVMASLLYVMVAFAVSPKFVGFAALLASAAFAFFLCNDKGVFDKFPMFAQEILSLEAKLNKEGLSPIMPDAEPQDSNTRYYTLKKPETLKQISANPEIYGGADYWFSIYQANRTLISDPTEPIPAGTRLAIPKIKGSPTKARFYKVKKESFLKDICALNEVYGNSGTWKSLFDANKAVLKDPELPVLANTTLLVPELPKTPYSDFFRIAMAYAAAAFLAYCWRLLIGKMYVFFNIAMGRSSGASQKEISDLKKKMQDTNEEYRLFKEEVAINIVEMQKITEAGTKEKDKDKEE